MASAKPNASLHELADKLDLSEHFETLSSLLARPKELAIEGDRNLHFELIKELSCSQFNQPLPLSDLDQDIVHLTKHGVLGAARLYEFAKLTGYFEYLKKQSFGGRISSWLDTIAIPIELLSFQSNFTNDGDLRDDINDALHTVCTELLRCKQSIAKEISRLTYSEKLSAYLVDRQLHLHGDEECLLLRPGFTHVIKARIVGRSGAGFFYAAPQSADALKERSSALTMQKEQLRYEICKTFSEMLAKNLLFFKFLNRQFDRFDHYQARVFFARSLDLTVLQPTTSQSIILDDFIHPALLNKKAKPFTIDFRKKALLITGVNAGGKTMLLKSILSAALMAKYLIPMRTGPKTVIGSFQSIEAVVEDPQNVRDDISTFAGRMVKFAKFFGAGASLIGVDEVELGTDSDEAASLFKVLSEKLILQGAKLVMTTHHKRLAALLAANEEVELVAALYDEKASMPTYQFLQGSIGKSYAFETAQRYGIPRTFIQEARTLWGEDKERLGELIERSTQLQLDLKRKIAEAADEAQSLRQARFRLEDEYEIRKNELVIVRAKLEREFFNATKIAKEAAKLNDPREIHRQLNEAQKAAKLLEQAQTQVVEQKKFAVGDAVRYGSLEGTIVRLDDKAATLESDGKTLRVQLELLQQRAKQIQKLPKRKNKATNITVEKPGGARLKLDLHGLRAEEAIELLDKFISDALLSGFGELFVYHGIGSGKLSRAVREYLKIHPSVKSFEDAPANLGGFGATIVYL